MQPLNETITQEIFNKTSEFADSVEKHAQYFGFTRCHYAPLPGNGNIEHNIYTFLLEFDDIRDLGNEPLSETMDKLFNAICDDDQLDRDSYSYHIDCSNYMVVFTASFIY